jgi:RNA polymerase sigma factor (sigma-70 family)
MDFFTFDDEYVRRLREGDRWTVDHFYSYFQSLLQIVLRKWGLRSSQEIDDVRQEVFVRVFQALGAPDGGLRDGTKLGPWVLGICRNVFREHCREVGRTDPLEEEHLDIPSWDDPVRELIRAQDRQRVHRVIHEMETKDKRDADILRALFLHERHPDDVCREFGVDRGYLRVLLFRAKQKFRDLWPPK